MNIRTKIVSMVANHIRWIGYAGILLVIGLGVLFLAPLFHQEDYSPYTGPVPDNLWDKSNDLGLRTLTKEEIDTRDFSDFYDSVKGLFMVDIDGGNEFPINLSFCSSPQAVTFSPDGRTIAFLLNVRGSSIDTIIALFFPDRRIRLLMNVRLDLGDSLSWSPSGKQLLFTAALPSDSKQCLFMIHPDGSGLRKIAESKAWGIWCAAWAPNGKQIAYYDDRMITLINPDGSFIKSISLQHNFKSFTNSENSPTSVRGMYWWNAHELLLLMGDACSADLGILDVNSEQLTLLTKGLGLHKEISVSPQDSLVLISIEKSTNDPGLITYKRYYERLSVRPEIILKEFPNNIREGAISPDRKHLLFSTCITFKEENMQVPPIWIYRDMSFQIKPAPPEYRQHTPFQMERNKLAAWILGDRFRDVSRNEATEILNRTISEEIISSHSKTEAINVLYNKYDEELKKYHKEIRK